MLDLRERVVFSRGMCIMVRIYLRWYWTYNNVSLPIAVAIHVYTLGRNTGQLDYGTTVTQNP